MSSPKFLFVYGTLRRGTGHPMAVFLEKHSTYRGSAKTAGRLYDLGESPGMCEAQSDDDWVFGDLYELTDVEQVLAELDRYEGCGPEDPQPWYFERFVREASDPDGSGISCWVYLYRRPVREQCRIVSGVYSRDDLHEFDWRKTL